MFDDPNTNWWSIVALRMTTALLAGIAFIAVADAVAESTTATEASPIAVTAT